MAKRNTPKINEGTPIGRDVDLAQEGVRLRDGTRLTDDVVAEIVERVRRGTTRSRPTRAEVSKRACGGDGRH
jgi:hypothetical protein